MKVSAILTIASLCFVGKTKAAPAVGSSASEIVKIDGKGKNELDVDYDLSTINAINKKHETGGDSSILETDQDEFIVKVMEKIKEERLMDEFF